MIFRLRTLPRPTRDLYLACMPRLFTTNALCVVSPRMGSRRVGSEQGGRGGETRCGAGGAEVRVHGRISFVRPW